MRKIYIISSLLILISCSDEKKENLDVHKNEINRLTTELKKSEKEKAELKAELKSLNTKTFDNEDFDNFFWGFMTDSIFQLERIKFPLKYITWKDDLGGEIDTLEINKVDYKYNSFYINFASERTQVYDNYELKLQPTNERLIHWYGVETGGDSKYYFKGFNGKWYLIKKEQLGD